MAQPSSFICCYTSLIEESNSKSVFIKDLGEYPLRKFHTLFVQGEQ